MSSASKRVTAQDSPLPAGSSNEEHEEMVDVRSAPGRHFLTEVAQLKLKVQKESERARRLERMADPELYKKIQALKAQCLEKENKFNVLIDQNEALKSQVAATEAEKANLQAWCDERDSTVKYLGDTLELQKHVSRLNAETLTALNTDLKSLCCERNTRIAQFGREWNEADIGALQRKKESVETKALLWSKRQQLSSAKKETKVYKARLENYEAMIRRFVSITSQLTATCNKLGERVASLESERNMTDLCALTTKVIESAQIQEQQQQEQGQGQLKGLTSTQSPAGSSAISASTSTAKKGRGRPRKPRTPEELAKEALKKSEKKVRTPQELAQKEIEKLERQLMENRKELVEQDHKDNTPQSPLSNAALSEPPSTAKKARGRPRKPRTPQELAKEEIKLKKLLKKKKRQQEELLEQEHEKHEQKENIAQSSRANAAGSAPPSTAKKGRGRPRKTPLKETPQSFLGSPRNETSAVKLKRSATEAGISKAGASQAGASRPAKSAKSHNSLFDFGAKAAAAAKKKK